jgi:hypothetical protein
MHLDVGGDPASRSGKVHIMFITRLLPRRRGTRVVATATAVVVSLCGASAAIDMRAAGAIGITHKIVQDSKQNTSAAVEAARFSFSCNDATNVYKFKAKGVQVIKSDHVTPWGSYELRIYIEGAPPGPWVVDIPLTQNATNGLYEATSAGFVPSGSCATGNAVFFADDQDQETEQLLYIFTLG